MSSQRQDLEENRSKKRMNYSSTNIYGSKAGCRCRCRCSQDAGIFNRLPLELWMGILSLLPVKSLMILRAVCKSFLSIIHDSRFAPLHLRRFPYNATETRFLTIQRDSNGATYQVRDSTIDGFAPIATAHINEPGLQTGEEVIWSLAGSLDGLHVIVSIPTTVYSLGSRTVVLWNPSIRKIRQLSLPSLVIKDFGLGYHPLCKDYKIVAASATADEAWLYSVETGSWSELINSGVRLKRGVRRLYSQSLSFNGGVLWIDCGYFHNHTKYDRLVLFDFGTERFRYTEEMPYSVGKCTRTGSRLVMLDGGSSVGVLGVDEQEQASVWALEMDTMSWTRRYKIAPDVLPDLPRWAGIGRVRFIEKSGELAWKYWTGKSLRVLTYDTETQAIKRHQEFAGIVQDCLGVHFESLIMLN